MIIINWMENTERNPAGMAIYTKNDKKIISTNSIIKPMSFLKKLSNKYLKNAKKLGYSWRDLIRKDTRQLVINKINQNNQTWKQILHKAKIDTYSDQMRIKYELDKPKVNMDQYKEQYIEQYNEIPYTIKDARKSELSMSNAKDRNKKSFISLFKARLDTIIRPKHPVSITVKTTNKLFETIIEKQYGPFQTMMPVGLSQDDKYKFVLYTLLNSNISLLSGESIYELGFDIIKLEKRNIIHHKMGRLKLETYLLKHQKPIKSHGSDLCVIDYIYDAIKGKRGFKRYDFDRLKNEINEYVFDGPMISTYEIIEWAKSCHPNTVSIHAFDSRYKKFISHISPEARVSLVFIVKDNHLTPISDPRLKEIATYTDRSKKSLLTYMTDIKWSMKHDKVTVLNDCTDVNNIGISDNILILPDGTKMNQAIDQYMKSSNYYVEMIKYNNNGMIDAFVDHRGNMIVSNNDYDIRKQVCEKLYSIYKSDDFVWCNQSFTSLVISLFNQLSGQVDESAYNTQARNIIDSYYPKALQWVNRDYDITDEDILNIKSIDISKCYPSILLHNKSLIPVYTIHDKIEEFDPINDNIVNHAEYYIDEYNLAIYGANIAIESAFYSSDLIEYLLSFGMPRNQIKYKFVAKRCLKADTYGEFIRYIFDNFPEKIAKILANNFIGHLGRKYSKTDRGFVCTNYETVLCCWTHATLEGKNLSINKYNDTYLLREQTCERLFQDNTSINRFVISQAILKTLKLINKCCDDKSTLISINTDGFNVLNPCTIFKHKRDVQFDTSCIGKPFMTQHNFSYIERHYRDNIDISEFDTNQGYGVIYTGIPGSGKTHKLCEMVMECSNPLILSYTNKAVENCKTRLIDKGYENINKICYTLDSYFAMNNIDALRDKTLFLEEFSMIPNRFINIIYNAFIKYGLTIYMFGDSN